MKNDRRVPPRDQQRSDCAVATINDALVGQAEALGEVAAEIAGKIRPRGGGCSNSADNVSAVAEATGELTRSIEEIAPSQVNRTNDVVARASEVADGAASA